MASGLGLIAAVLILIGAARAEDQKKEDACKDEPGLAMLASPFVPWKGAPLRVLMTSETALDGELSLIAPDGSTAATSRERRGGPPYFWIADVAEPTAGKWQAVLSRDGAKEGCKKVTREITVRKAQGAAPKAQSKSVWPVREAWNRETENLYSAWIEKLFDAPAEEQLSWPKLAEVLKDKSRNFLFNHYGLKEDDKGLGLEPDCADLPYFLRGYFAFKVGLPYGYSKCSRGGGGRPPKCVKWWNIQSEEPPSQPPQTQSKSGGGGLFGLLGGPEKPAAASVPARPQSLVPAFQSYMRNTVANSVHSGCGRTAAADDNGDYYPVPLTQESLRPGTIYADPYGHILVLVKRLPQTASAAGVFLAVDGQPDGTVARKRFWRGNFLFAQDEKLGGAGFKRFRPIVRDGSAGLRKLTNAEIGKTAAYQDFSLDPSKLGVEDFYDRMDDVMSPEPLDPMIAIKDAITSLEEQVKTRVTSVENGRKYQTGGGEASMPEGAAIFETTGAWEDFATPSRDLRLLIAIDVVKGFPDRVARRTERYQMPKDKSVADVKSELEGTLASELAARKVTYTRTDGSPWTLTLKDVIERSAALEMAYNVNDCAELRWGAAEKSDEAATCKGRAPEAQRARMEKYREWFRDRRRPPRP